MATFNGRKNVSGGFSLLEILIALVLLSVCATVLFQLFSRSSRNIAISEDYVAGAVAGQASMRKMIEAETLKEGTSNETTDNGYRVETRVVEALKERTENLQFRLLDIDMSVKWVRGPKEKVIRLRTLKLIDKTRLGSSETSSAPVSR